MATIATIVDLVTEVIQPAIKEPFELVDVEYGKMGGDYVLSIFVDKPEGITLNDTADLTEIISPLLDQIKPDPFPEQYLLEVTSPGLETFENQGKHSRELLASMSISACIRLLKSKRSLRGTLVGFEEDVLTIEYMDKTRKKTVEIPYNLVSKARLAVNCNRMKERMPL